MLLWPNGLDFWNGIGDPGSAPNKGLTESRKSKAFLTMAWRRGDRGPANRWQNTFLHAHTQTQTHTQPHTHMSIQCITSQNPNEFSVIEFAIIIALKSFLQGVDICVSGNHRQRLLRG